jgi:hypothetical protein
MSQQFTQEELNAMQHSIHTWLRTRNEQLKPLMGDNGYLTPENANAIFTFIENDFAGYATVDNLDAALHKAKDARRLRFKVEPQANKAAKTTTSVTGFVNHASTTEVSGAAAWKEWLKTAPAGLKGPDGTIGVENTRMVQEVLAAEFGGRATVRNIGAAVSLLKAQQRLHWTVLPLTEEQKGKLLEAKDNRNLIERDSTNRAGEKDPKVVLAAAEEAAKKKVYDLWTKADSTTKARIKAIVDADIAAKRSPAVTVVEVDALLKVKRIYDNPEGRNHHEQKFFRDEIDKIIEDERRDGTTAFWNRVAQRVNREVVKDRSVR